MEQKRQSYTSQSGLVNMFRQAAYLYDSHSQDIPGSVRRSIEDCNTVEKRLLLTFDLEVKDLDVLEIGPGQYLAHMAYFSRENRVTGIDLDVIATNNSISTYAEMLKRNGAWRMIKTIGRKLMRIDANFQAELYHQLTYLDPPIYNVLQMDVSSMRFDNDSFDLVYSRAVFQHVPDPSAAIAEISRVLRPGGIAYISLHPYTNPTGSLDSRVLAGRSDDIGLWPHLQDELQSLVQSNAHLNKIRLPEWQRIFREFLPDAKIILSPCEPEYIDAASQMHESGKLERYSIEELTTGAFVVLWRKPKGD